MGYRHASQDERDPDRPDAIGKRKEKLLWQRPAEKCQNMKWDAHNKADSRKNAKEPEDASQR